MSAPQQPAEAPPGFARAVEALREAMAAVRADVGVHELPPPVRVAPYAFAVAGQLEREGEEMAAGRLVLLFDPAGQAAWEGRARFVCYARAGLDPEMAADPLLPEVAWSWLLEALDAQEVGRRALGGTVTTTSSRRFGQLAADGDSSELELRCSWSPGTDGPDPGSLADPAAHLRAFRALLAAMAGLPPPVPGVVPLPSRHSTP